MFKFFENYGRSTKWSSVRKEHLKNNPQCEACGRKTGLEVHHIVPYHIDQDKELDPNNLITLCDKYCHFVFGHLMDWKSWNINVKDDALKYSLIKENRPHKEVFASQDKRFYYEIFNFINYYFCWPFNIFKFWDNRS